MRILSRGYAIRWGNLAFLLGLCVFVLLYLSDARSTSLKMANLLLLEPASIIALVLIACVVPQCFRRLPLHEMAPDDAGEQPPEAHDRPSRNAQLPQAFSLMVLFGIFCIFLEQIGFDVATFLFVAVGLVVCGERRSWLVLLFSTIFTLLIIYGYGLLVPYPFPLKIL